MILVTDKHQEVMKRAAFKFLIERGIRDESELKFVCQEILGARVPQEVCCDEHQPLWSVVVDDFFNRVKKQAVRHARGGGKTFIVATSKSLKLLNYGGIRIANFAATETQGHALYGYVNGHLGPGAIPEVQARVAKVESSTTVMRPAKVEGRVREESSLMKVLVGTLKGVNSSHVEDLVMDERAQMDDDVAKESIGMMTPKAPYPGVLTVLSTVKQTGDGMDRLLTNADDAGYTTYVSCILDVINCQEKNCDGCKKSWSYNSARTERKNLFDFCGGRLLGRNLGHYDVQGARLKFEEMSLENATAQLFCLAPEGEETAFPSFSRSNNVVDLDSEVTFDPFYVMGDFGKTDDSAWIKAYYLEDLRSEAVIYINDESVDKGKTMQEWVPILRNRKFDKAAAWLVDVAGRQTTIVSKKSAIDYMRDEGWTVVSQKMDEVETTERLRTLVGQKRVLVHPRCKRTIEAFHRATNKAVGTGDDKTFLKIIKHNKFSHPIDAIRYGTFLLNPDDHQPLPGKYKIGGNKKRKSRWN